MKAITGFIRENKWLVVILLLGTILRLIDIAKPFSGLAKWNEGHYAVTALNYFKYGIFLPMNEYGLDLTTTPLYTWLIYLSFRIFGVHEWAARLPSLFFGIVSLILVYYIAERLYDKRVGLVATLIAAISPGIAYFSRNTQLESMFTAFALAALLFMLYYRDSGDAKWLAASGVYLSIAILTKYPAILVYPALLCVWFESEEYRRKFMEKVRLFLYLLLPLIPSLLWLFYAMSLKPRLTTWYFHKPEGPVWTLSTAAYGVYLGIVKFIPEHFGYVFYLAFLLSIPLLLKDLKKHMPILLFTFSWILLIFVFPDFYLSNMYYHYTMLYGMAILLGYSVIRVGEKLAEVPNLNLKTIGALAFAIVMALSLYQYNVYFHSYYTDFSKANETEPFQSAKYVAAENTGHKLVVADLPMTLFYLGGDPEHIRLAYTTQGLINAVEEEKYTYLVTYYAGNRTLKDVLEEHNYTQIAPRAWKKSG